MYMIWVQQCKREVISTTVYTVTSTIHLNVVVLTPGITVPLLQNAEYICMMVLYSVSHFVQPSIEFDASYELLIKALLIIKNFTSVLV